MDNLQRLLLSCFVGGPLVILQVTSFVFAIGNALRYEPHFLYAFLLIIVSVASALLALRVMGFWGRWSLMLLFYICPLVIIFDYVNNPWYPSATVLMVGFYCLYFILKQKKS